MPEKTHELRGAKLLCAAVNHILAHPETWDQSVWHCGTKHCIAGHCELLATGKESVWSGSIARDLLGIYHFDGDYLFGSSRTLWEIYAFAESLLIGHYEDAECVWSIGADGYSRRGYDRMGLDRRGCDRRGYNRDGIQIQLQPFDLENVP